MIDEIITKVGNAIRDTLGSWFTLSWIPEHYWWIAYLILFGMFCGFVIWFFGWSKIVRMVTSFLFLAAAIFVAGGYVMARKMTAKQAAQKVKEQQRQRQAQRPAQQADEWKWPWQ